MLHDGSYDKAHVTINGMFNVCMRERECIFILFFLKSVSNEAKSSIFRNRIVNLAGDYEQTVKCKMDLLLHLISFVFLHFFSFLKFFSLLEDLMF